MVRPAELPQDVRVLADATPSIPDPLPPGVRRRRISGSEGVRMSSNIYVGNLSFTTTTADLQSLFAPHGDITRAQVVTDRDTGRSRGFGFVEMASADAAKAAIETLNGHKLDGRDLTVNLAKERSR
jgi:RNA recognition motif-containing protein